MNDGIRIDMVCYKSILCFVPRENLQIFILEKDYCVTSNQKRMMYILFLNI